MMRYWITVCLLVLPFIYLDSCFPPDGLWCRRRELIVWRRHFSGLLLLKIRLRALVKPGTQKPSPASLFPLNQLKAACQLQNTSEIPRKLLYNKSWCGRVECDPLTQFFCVLCGYSLHVSLTFFVYFLPLLRDEPHLVKEKIFIKAVVGFCFCTLRTLFNFFF